MIQSFRADPSFGERLENLGRLCPAGHEGHIRSIRFECFFERLLVALSLGGHNDEGSRSNPQPVQVQVPLHLLRIRITLAVRLWSSDGNSVVDRLGETGQCSPHGGAAHDQNMRLGQNRLDINVERATTVTAHVVGHNAFLLRPRWTDADQPRPSILERLQCLLDYRRLRAAAANPAPKCAVGQDDRLVAHLARDRRQIAHHFRNRKGLTFREQFAGLTQKLIEHPTGTSPMPAGSPGYAPEQIHPREGALRPCPE